MRASSAGAQKRSWKPQDFTPRSASRKMLPCFSSSRGARCALEKNDSGFSLKNSGHHFRMDTLLDYAEKSQKNFSPRVCAR